VQYRFARTRIPKSSGRRWPQRTRDLLVHSARARFSVYFNCLMQSLGTTWARNLLGRTLERREAKASRSGGRCCENSRR
jgi:hypothetical protein